MEGNIEVLDVTRIVMCNLRINHRLKNITSCFTMVGNKEVLDVTRSVTCNLDN